MTYTTSAPARRAFTGLRLLPVLAALLPFSAHAQSQPSLARTATMPSALAAPSVSPYVGTPAMLATTSAAPSAAPASAEPQTTVAPAVSASATTAQPVALQSRSFAPAEAPRAPHVSRQSSTALMIVGFAAMIVGAVVDGDAGTLIMVGGAGVGLYGLYHYLN
ncbi:hypothetical protein [Gemmatimonas sp.]|uniref:hypothetical protein n=1 Tax=Gemmatimonas sp. TaxID=1962908 RepID=UPI002ED82B5D